MSHLRFIFGAFFNFLISLSSRAGGPHRVVAGGCGFLLIVATTCCCFSLLLAPVSDKDLISALANTATSMPSTSNVRPVELPKATVILSKPNKTPLAPPNTNIPAPTNITVPTDTKTPTPTQIPASPLPTITQLPSPTTESTFPVLVLTSPVQAGQTATIQIQTVPGTSCFLAYTTPSGSHSSAKGLGETTADNAGICSWTWNISASTKAGTGKLAIKVNDVTQIFDIVIQQ